MSNRPIAMLLHKTVVHDSRVRREAATLARAGHRVVVVELDRAAEGELDGFERRSAAPPARVKSLLPFQIYRVAFLIWFIYAVVRLRPTVVHAHDAAMLLPGAIAAQLTRARLVYDSHELATGVSYRETRWAAFVALVERVLIRRASTVITVTDGIAERLQARYRLAARPIVVRNVCALPPGSPDGSLRERLGIGTAPLVLHQGAAAPQRGCETLVRAMAMVPGAHVVFLGSGEPGFDRRLAALAADVRVAERTHFVPSLPLEELLARTAEADVGISLLEPTCDNHRLALPNKVFEYVAAGVPVVTSDLPELRRLVDAHGIGWTVDPADPRRVGTAIRAALASAGDGQVQARVRAAARALNWDDECRPLVAAYALWHPDGADRA